MTTTICFDFGNTRLKAGIFNDHELVEIAILSEQEHLSEIKSLIINHKPDFVTLSSVIHHNPELEIYIQQHCHFHKISHLSNLPFTIPVGKPESVGADRLALCAAAAATFPNHNNLIIGLGTCITYNFINLKQQFLGGSISPGLEMRFQSMHTQTALLPRVKMDWNFPLVGYDTKTNLLSGVALGMAKEIDGIIEAYEEKFETLSVLLTGGDTLHFAPLLKKRIFADPHLIFKGIYAISTWNRA
jgi:type III pantothenate kinase